ncbi:cytochrome c and c1 heme-lyase [Martensiomyces pterosporus]|nr:cytochrome c and c1 heme-lyase [Martensiomyces pterosporus]
MGKGSAGEANAACPVDHNSEAAKAFLPDGGPKIDPHNQMPLVPEQNASPGQQGSLSTERTMSSIPRADRYQSAGPSECPALHDTDGDAVKREAEGSSKAHKDRWIYPSEQMFFNAMKRKNWNPREEDMKSVVPIHNAVNEMCWNRILEWENMHKSTCGGPQLLRFEGKANDLTPRARFRTMLGYRKPFDRHDWTVDRCGKPVRYVIDFYEGKKDERNPLAPSFYLDVRPALTLEGAWDRARKYWGF